MGFFDAFVVPPSETDKLKNEIIQLIKDNVKDYDYNIYWFQGGDGQIDIGEGFSLYVNSDNSIIKKARVLFKGHIILGYNAYDNFGIENNIFYRQVKDIFFEAYKKKDDDRKMRNKLQAEGIISEALAHLISQKLTGISQDVKDEFNPIFDKVKRVQEITKELEGIRKEFSITGG